MKNLNHSNKVNSKRANVGTNYNWISFVLFMFTPSQQTSNQNLWRKKPNNDNKKSASKDSYMMTLIRVCLPFSLLDAANAANFFHTSHWLQIIWNN